MVREVGVAVDGGHDLLFKMLWKMRTKMNMSCSWLAKTEECVGVECVEWISANVWKYLYMPCPALRQVAINNCATRCLHEDHECSFSIIWLQGHESLILTDTVSPHSHRSILAYHSAWICMTTKRKKSLTLRSSTYAQHAGASTF